MGTARLRGALDRLSGGFAAFRLRHVADRNDADQPLLAVYHRQAPHLDVAHVLCDVVEILVVVAIHDLGAHDLAHRSVGTLARAHRPDGDVTVGDHADEPVVLAHRHRAGVDFFHDFRYFPDALARGAHAHLARHRFAHSHRLSLEGN